MRTRNTKQAFGASALKPLLATASLALLVATSPAQAAGRNPNPRIAPPNSNPYGHSYGEWSAELWKQAIEGPVAGNPFVEGGCFELSRAVWAVAAPLGPAVHECTVPVGKGLFLPSLTIECSSLEPPETGFHGDTEEEQAECATYWADHIVDLSVEIDGAPVQTLESYRVV